MFYAGASNLYRRAGIYAFVHKVNGRTNFSILPLDHSEKNAMATTVVGQMATVDVYNRNIDFF